MASVENSDIIDALAKNEQYIAALYKKYADRFPDYREFWENLSAEELVHAEKLQTISQVKSGDSILIKGRFNIIAIQNFSKRVLAEAESVNIINSTLVSALSMALNIEQSLIEQKYFEVFESDAVELKQVFSSLAADTRRHLENVRQLWAKQQQ